MPKSQKNAPAGDGSASAKSAPDGSIVRAVSAPLSLRARLTPQPAAPALRRAARG